MANGQVSVRGNAAPAGGATSTMTQSGQGQPLIMSTDQLQILSETFMENSEYNDVKLNQVALTAGQQASFNINNIGLGESLEFLVQLTFTVQNTNTGSVTLNVAPEAPFDLLSQIITQFNGQTVLDSLNGYDLFGVMLRKNGKILQPSGIVLPQIASITVSGSGVTTTTGSGLTNLTSITIPTTDTATVTMLAYYNLPFVVSKELLMGLLPMQNNSVYLSVQVTAANILGTDQLSILSAASIAGLTLTTTSFTCQPTYNFWAVPVPNNVQLYNQLISNNYMVLTIPNQTFQATGDSAINFNMPNNYYLMSVIATVRDSTKKLVSAIQSGAAVLDNPRLSYNTTAIVEKRDMLTRTARQAVIMSGALPPGVILWDGMDAEHRPNVNTAKWLNMYQANNPTFLVDIPGAVSTPGTFRICREQLVPANVAVL